MRPSLNRSSRRPVAPPGVPLARRQVGRSRVPLHRQLLTARSALVYWVAVIVLAVITASLISRLMDRADAVEHRFGPVRSVLVTRVAMRAGQHLSSENTERTDRPVAQLPVGVLDHLPPAVSVSGPVARGEVLTRTRLESSSTDPPRDTATIAVPLGQAPLAVRAGDHVDVYAVYDPSLTPRNADSTTRVAARAEVVGAGRTSATLRVRDVEAPSLAAAVARATVTLALVR